MKIYINGELIYRLLSQDIKALGTLDWTKITINRGKCQFKLFMDSYQGMSLKSTKIYIRNTILK
jgi:hypothetical protein